MQLYVLRSFDLSRAVVLPPLTPGMRIVLNDETELRVDSLTVFENCRYTVAAVAVQYSEGDWKPGWHSTVGKALAMAGYNKYGREIR